LVEIAPLALSKSYLVLPKGHDLLQAESRSAKGAAFIGSLGQRPRDLCNAQWASAEGAIHSDRPG
jgi:hypothetical protein